MTLIKRNLNPTVPRFFDDFFTRTLFDWDTQNHSSTNTSIPAVNIKETSDHFHVEMAAPGMNKKDFKIELKDEMLVISSEKKLRKELGEGERCTRQEFSYESFQRAFQLPKQLVNWEEIKAVYENGILKIQIPKREEAKALPPRQIAIQ